MGKSSNADQARLGVGVKTMMQSCGGNRARRALGGALSLSLALGAAVPALAQDGGGASEPQAAPVTPTPAATQRLEPVAVRVVWTQFVSSVVVGDPSDEMRYGGKLDGYLDIKGSAAGLDDSLRLHVHPEFRYGASTNGAVGLLPTNSQLFYPRDGGEVFDLSVNLTKTFGSGASLAVGKFNLLEQTEALPVVGGGGAEGFQNLALALPPSTIVPGSIFGAMLTVPTEKALLRLWVFDSKPQSRRSGLEDPFDRGVTALGAATFPVRLGGQPGFYTIKAIGSTRTGAVFDNFPAPLVPPRSAGYETSKGAWALALSFQQFLTTAPGRKGIGVFGEVAVLDGRPTPLDFHAFFGISGTPAARPQDSFGIAWFRYSISDPLAEAIASRVALQDEEGIEAFYTVQVGGPFRLTADVQVVDPAIAARSIGVIAGLRLKTTF